MGMFDEPGDPSPLTEAVALVRAHKCVEPIARFLMYMSALLLFPAMVSSDLPAWFFGTIAGAVWYVSWVVLFRRWKAWAVSRGCDAEYLEWLGEESGVVAARGSWLWYLQWPAHAP